MSQFPVFTRTTVRSIVNLSKNHPVYRVTMINGKEFVAKADKAGAMGSDAAKIAKFDSKLMGQVSSNTNIEVMTKAEIADLLLCMGMVDPPDQRKLFKENVASPQMFWYKMPMLKVTTVQDMYDADEAALLRKVFKDTRALKKLGKIAAVDLFIGNTDRFTSAGDVANPGNIFFAKKRGLLKKTTFTPIGLDFWDGFKDDMNLTLTESRWDHLRRTQSADTANFLEDDFKRRITTLNNFAAMLDFAENTMSSMSADLQNAGVEGIDGGKSKYKEAMAKGMLEGADGLKKFLLQMIKKKGGMGALPPGALYRMQLLRWV
jgi:hypothetical protein